MSGQERGPMSAAEFMAQLERDEEYQAGRAAFDAELDQRTRALRAAEEPIVSDLAAAGVPVESVWDLVNTDVPYPDALPVLLEHLEQGGYPDRVMEGLGRALAVKPAVVFWDRLEALYLASRGPGEEEGTAVALAACATDAHLDDLLGLLAAEERGASRIFFIRPALNVGGKRGHKAVESLRSDPILGKEATALTTETVLRCADRRQVNRHVSQRS